MSDALENLVNIIGLIVVVFLIIILYTARLRVPILLIKLLF